MKRKLAGRPDWKRVIERRDERMYLESKFFNGYMSVIHIKKVTEPLIIKMGNKELKVADSGYTWVEFIPKDKNYVLTIMYDTNDEIVQWYFDVSKENGVNNEAVPYFDDLYLDVVVVPSHEAILIDEEDLSEALKKEIITKDDYEFAYKVADKIMNELVNEYNLKQFGMKYLEHKYTV